MRRSLHSRPCMRCVGEIFAWPRCAPGPCRLQSRPIPSFDAKEEVMVGQLLPLRRASGEQWLELGRHLTFLLTPLQE